MKKFGVFYLMLFIVVVLPVGLIGYVYLAEYKGNVFIKVPFVSESEVIETDALMYSKGKHYGELLSVFSSREPGNNAEKALKVFVKAMDTNDYASMKAVLIDQQGSAADKQSFDVHRNIWAKLRDVTLEGVFEYSDKHAFLLGATLNDHKKYMLIRFKGLANQRSVFTATSESNLEHLLGYWVVEQAKNNDEALFVSFSDYLIKYYANMSSASFLSNVKGEDENAFNIRFFGESVDSKSSDAEMVNVLGAVVDLQASFEEKNVSKIVNVFPGYEGSALSFSGVESEEFDGVLTTIRGITPRYVLKADPLYVLYVSGFGEMSGLVPIFVLKRQGQYEIVNMAHITLSNEIYKSKNLLEYITKSVSAIRL